MFTGIIEEIGSIRSVARGTHSAVLSVRAERILEDIHTGDSIAVNGVCLTVSSFDKGGFTADVMHETLNRSGLGALKTDSPVNLERAMRADGRFGGHIVSGHIDGTGTIIGVRKDDNAVWYQPDGGRGGCGVIFRIRHSPYGKADDLKPPASRRFGESGK